MGIVAIILAVFGWLLLTVGWIILLVAAFKVSTGWGLISLFVPFGVFVFVVQFWKQAKTGFLIYIGGVPLAIVGAILMMSVAVEEAKIAVAATTVAAASSNASGNDAKATPTEPAKPSNDGGNDEPSEDNGDDDDDDDDFDDPGDDDDDDDDDPDDPDDPDGDPDDDDDDDDADDDDDDDDDGNEKKETNPNPIPSTLFGKAGYAWEQGKLNTGLQYFYAAGLVENESQVWSKLRWCEALGRPVVAPRWGIVVQTPLAGTTPAVKGARKDPASSQGPDEAAPDDTDDNGEPDTEDDPDSDNEGDDDGGNAGAPQSATALVSANKAASIELLRTYTKSVGPEMHRLLTEATTIKGLANTPLAFLTSLGVEKTTEDVLGKARSEAVDVVAMISVIVKKIGLRGKPDAELTISIVDVASGATLWKGKSLKGRKYSYELTKGRDVGVELAAAAMAEIEKLFVLSDQPTVSFEKLQQRLAKSADREKTAPLRALAEVRYLQLQGSITASESQQSFARLIGEDAAESLSVGTPQQKLEAVSEFLPELKAGANRAIQRLAPVRQSAQR